jgi:hypothetical protein
MPGGGGIILRRSAPCRAGIVDENIEPSRPLSNRFGQPIGRILVPQIGDCAFRGSWALISRDGGQRIQAMVGRVSLTDVGY